MFLMYSSDIEICSKFVLWGFADYIPYKWFVIESFNKENISEEILITRTYLSFAIHVLGQKLWGEGKGFWG